MGLFGPKKSKEEKNYEAVYKKFPSKKAGAEELESAIAAWEAADGPKKEVWKAYFLMAIAYDCGRKVELDEARAKGYHEKARRLIDESGNARWKTWADSFYYWYAQSSINFLHEQDTQTLNVRRLGNAGMNALGLTGLAFMIGEIADTMSDISIYADGKRAKKTADAFYSYFLKCRYHITKEEELINNNADPSKFDGDRDEIREFFNRDQEEKNGPDDEENWSDLHQYIYGLTMVQKAPLCFVQFTNDPQLSFIVRMFNAGVAGNSMALRQLVELAFRSPEDHKYVAKSMNDMSERAMDEMFKDYLKQSERAGDYTATELLNRYYAK